GGIGASNAVYATVFLRCGLTASGTEDTHGLSRIAHSTETHGCASRTFKSMASRSRTTSPGPAIKWCSQQTRAASSPTRAGNQFPASYESLRLAVDALASLPAHLGADGAQERCAAFHPSGRDLAGQATAWRGIAAAAVSCLTQPS